MRLKLPENFTTIAVNGLLAIGIAACGSTASTDNDRYAGTYRDAHGSYSATGYGDIICPDTAPRPDGSFPGEPPGRLVDCKTATTSE